MGFRIDAGATGIVYGEFLFNVRDSRGCLVVQDASYSESAQGQTISAGTPKGASCITHKLTRSLDRLARSYVKTINPYVQIIYTAKMPKHVA